MKRMFLIALATMTMTAANATCMTDSVNNDTLQYDYMKELSAVTVKGHRTNTRLTGNSMITRIKGSALEKSGSAKEMLAKVPGMTQRDDELEVIGKGTPIYYINGRKMQDKDELKRLRSEEIQSVEVITNPGAEYDATVSAVVRIKTIRRKGDGFGFDVSAGHNQDLQYGNADPNATLNLHYNHNSLELFGMINYWKWDSVNDNYPDQISWMKNDQDMTSIQQQTHLRHDWSGQGFNYNLGFNYQIGKNHFIGARVEKHDKFNSGTYAKVNTDMTITRYIPSVPEISLPAEHEKNGSVQDDHQHQPYNWDGNVYYNGQVGKLGIDFNFDFMTTKTREDNTITEVVGDGCWVIGDGGMSGQSGQTTNTQHPTPNIMTQAQNSTARLLADKLVLSYPVWKGLLQMGTEMSFVKKYNDYVINGYPLPATQSEMKESNIAAFVQYGCQIDKVGNFNAGLRYEHVGFDYTDLLNSSNSMSRYTDELFPTFSWSNQWGPIQTSLAYSIKTVRPQYSMLDESIIYINSYSLQQGDPKLKNATMQEVSVNARWKWLNLFMAYERRDNSHSMWSYIYNDKGVILVKNINLEKPVRNFAAFITASPTFGVYSANWTAGWQKFFYSLNLADPREQTGQREVKFSKPLFIFDLNNTLRLKHSWQFEANMNIITAGDVMNYKLLDPSFNLRLVVQKCWLKNDALCLRASLSDVFNNVHTKMRMDCGYYVLNQTSYNNRQRLEVSLRYSFNASKSKYKGTGAGKDALSRLNSDN